MRFFSSAVAFTLAACAALVSAQAPTTPNAISNPISGDTITAGQSYDITWINPTPGTVTLTLMTGPANQLTPVTTIASNIPNDGSYTWNVPSNIPANSGYSIRISYDNNPANWNYSDRFEFVSSVTATSSAASSTASSASSESSSSAASTSSEASTTSESSASSTSSATSSAATSSAITTSGNSTTIATTTTRRPTTSTPPPIPTGSGAPVGAGSTTLSSPVAVIMAVLAAALFIH
ncbi:hypothetical protein TWF696_001947 [Orbilia brochopaga]|uniref:Yeast cell wall synthesis Kre9/Knh1-like N-terminal domain-containing protein n=1 Tax=Orbilia brochopaga TaxID=3140254 RepID=A0AAV9U6E3_9PEZI